MEYATFNIEKIKSVAELHARYKHNRRIVISRNVVTEEIRHNRNQGDDVPKRIQKRIKKINSIRKKNKTTALRSDAIPAVELVLGASHNFFYEEFTADRTPRSGKDNSYIEDWAQVQIDWAKDYYKGRGRIVSWDLHTRDEKTPHVHIIFIPEKEALDKRTGKMLPTLSAKDFVGNKSEMNRARSSHAEANRVYDLHRGRNYHKEGKKSPEYRTLKQLKKQTSEAVEDLELVEGLYDIDLLENLDAPAKNRVKKIKNNRIFTPDLEEN